MPINRTELVRRRDLASRGALLSASRAWQLTIDRFTANLSWESTGSHGILLDEHSDVWTSGRVTALLPLESGGLLVGAETGGVWLVTRTSSAMPLSNSWNNPNVLALARGPRGLRHLYAGCQGALYETDPDATMPVFSWREIPSAGRTVYSIVVLAARKVVVTATNDGVWWSPMSSVPSGYVWTQASGYPSGACSSICAASADGIMAAAWGADVGAGRYGLFTGTWTSSGLTFSRAAIAGIDQKVMGRTSIASCAADTSIAYAIASNVQGETVLGVLRSGDGGQTWNAVSMPSGMGSQGEHNQCIAVGASDANRVAIGWRRAGPLISRDGGQTWEGKHEGGVDTNTLHSDLNALAFDSEDRADNTLYVASDGGVVVTRDLGETYDTGYNRHLGTLQFLREPFGTSSGSSLTPGLYGGGLQDNGNVYQRAHKEPWREYDGGDGHCMLFLASGALLRFANGTGGCRLSFWNGNGWDELGNVQPSGFTGVFEPKSAAVTKPRYRDASGALLVAVGGQGSEVFGLFDAGNRKFAWVRIGSVTTGLSIEGTGAHTGETIFAGTSDARLFAVDTKTGGALELNVAVTISSDRPDYQVRSPLIIDDSLGFALLFRPGGSEDLPFILQAQTGQVLRSRGLLKWEPLPNVPTEDGPVFAIATDWAQFPGALFAATDAEVWVSYDEGDTWGRSGGGRPRRVHCSDLRVTDNTGAGRWLYLATYGRSAWRARLDPWPESHPIPARPALSSQVATACRKADHIDVFWTGPDGAIVTAWWDPNFNNGRWNAVSGITAANAALPASPVGVVARNADHLDVFWVGPDGAIGSAWWDANLNSARWSTAFPVTAANATLPGTSVSVVARKSDHLDLFWIGPDGAVATTWWDANVNGAQWTAAFPITPPNAALPGSSVAAVARNPDHLDVFWTGADGAIGTAWWDASLNGGNWNAAFPISAPNAAVPGSPIAVVAREPDHLDVFWAGPDGAIGTSWWDADFNGATWNAPIPITAATAALPGSPVAVIARNPNHLDVFWVGPDGAIGTNWWDANMNGANWNRAFPITPAGAALAGGPISCSSRAPHHLDVFWSGRDGSVATVWWNAGSKGGLWNDAFPISPPQASCSPDHIDAFWVGPDAAVWTTWWDRANALGTWAVEFPVSPIRAAADGSPLAVVSRNPNQVDVFWIGSNRSVATSGWDRTRTIPWAVPFPITHPEACRAHSGIAVVSRNPDHIDVFWIGPDGAVGTTWWDRTNSAGWGTPFAITPPGACRNNSPLAAVSRNSDHLDVFWIGSDGAVGTTWWDRTNAAGWATPFAITPPGATRDNSSLAAVSRHSDHIDVFWIGTDGAVGTTWWDRVAAAPWAVPFPITPPGACGNDAALSAVSRNPDHVDVFWIGSDGAVGTTWWDRSGMLSWASPFPVTSPSAAADNSPLVGVSRNSDHVDLFWVGSDAGIGTTWWERPGPEWASAFPIARPASSNGTALAVCVRSGGAIHS